ncbi:hypothetical protein GIB67_033833 [Kingdonia uniflora]|uniref:Uncharacterized protein n=1 Tax=Kingdonia uniflora TaxID=39325 RepID=A0A7J7LIC4_9MAGN|nr:hypothetical protein GIB67_033833 [Kingdonia uniflora]
MEDISLDLGLDNWEMAFCVAEYERGMDCCVAVWLCDRWLCYVYDFIMFLEAFELFMF